MASVMPPADHMLAPNPPKLSIPVGMQRESFQAMGSIVNVLIPHQERTAARDIHDLFRRWEARFSRFRSDSELSTVNRRAGSLTLISQTFANVLAHALRAAEQTNGIFDPTLLHQIVRLGYDRDFERMSADLAPSLSLPQSGGAWGQIQFDQAERLLTMPAGVALDFGGIVKGLAVDAAIEALQHSGVSNALVEAGGDARVLGLPPEDTAWPIWVVGRVRGWCISLHHGAVATSGRDHRHWKQGELSRHHLLDPRTGLPVENGVWSVSVVSANCMQAEVAAKVAFVLGLESGIAFLEEHHLAGVIVLQSGRWSATTNWPLGSREA